MSFESFSSLPPELATFLIAMIPLGELRVALPIALTVYHMSLYSAFWFSVLGNIFPVYFFTIILEKGSAWLIKHNKFAKRFFDWLFARTRKKFTKTYEKWGKIGLMIFVAIPLPMTGAWTGTVAAYIFGINKKDSLIYNGLGVVIAGVIVSIVTLGVKGIFGWF